MSTTDLRNDQARSDTHVAGVVAHLPPDGHRRYDTHWVLAVGDTSTTPTHRGNT